MRSNRIKPERLTPMDKALKGALSMLEHGPCLFELKATEFLPNGPFDPC
jgi:hypothetical protein